MIEGVILQDNNFSDVIKVYEQTYFKEFNFESKLKYDIISNDYVYVVVYENKIPVGTGRLDIINSRIEYVSVIKNKRNLSYGDLIVRMLIDKSFKLGNFKVQAIIFEGEIDFYIKIGFVKVKICPNIFNYKKMIMEVNQSSLVKNCCH